MDGDRVMNSGANPFLSQEPHDLISILNPNRVDVINVLNALCFGRPDHLFQVVKRLIVLRGVRSPELISSFKMSQFNAQNGCLNSVHATVPTHHRMVIFADLAMISKYANFPIQHLVSGHNCAGFTESTQILSWVETETS